MKRPKTECKYEHKLSLCEVKSLTDKLRDREPTPAWVEEYKQTLSHFDCTMDWLSDIVIASNRCNYLGRRYTKNMLRDMLRNYKDRHIWTKGGQKTVNDYLDVLEEYLVKPEEVVCPSDFKHVLQKSDPEPVVERSEEGAELVTTKGSESPFAKAVREAFSSLKENANKIFTPPKTHKVKVRKVRVHKYNVGGKTYVYISNC